MMDKEFLEKVLDQLIEEASTIYVENENIEEIKIEDENVEFSDIHKQKMKNLFKEVRREENRKKAVKLTKRVAIILLCTLLLTCGLITTVEAWREEIVKFIMKNNDNNYMSIQFGNPEDEDELESGDINESENKEESNEFVIDDIKFLYLPEGFEFTQKENKNNVIYYSFWNGDNYIRLKKENFKSIYGKESDIENTVNEKFSYEDKEVFKIIKEDRRIAYVWYNNTNTYTVMSNISENEILKFIENIKILKNF